MELAILVCVLLVQFSVGQGNFTQSVLSKWTMIAPEAYTFEVNDPYLTLRKRSDAERRYNDGLFLRFSDSRPQHLKFSFKVGTGDSEAFDIRLGKIDNGVYVPEGDVLFFRAGFYNYTRINRDQMAFQHQIGKWYNIDIMFDWNEYSLDLYLDHSRISTTSFYRKDRNTKDFSHVNALYVYALTPGSESTVTNLMLCTERCPGDEKTEFSFGIRPTGVHLVWLALIIGILTFL